MFYEKKGQIEYFPHNGQHSSVALVVIYYHYKKKRRQIQFNVLASNLSSNGLKHLLTKIIVNEIPSLIKRRLPLSLARLSLSHTSLSLANLSTTRPTPPAARPRPFSAAARPVAARPRPFSAAARRSPTPLLGRRCRPTPPAAHPRPSRPAAQSLLAQALLGLAGGAALHASPPKKKKPFAQLSPRPHDSPAPFLLLRHSSRSRARAAGRQAAAGASLRRGLRSPPRPSPQFTARAAAPFAVVPFATGRRRALRFYFTLPTGPPPPPREAPMRSPSCSPTCTASLRPSRPQRSCSRAVVVLSGG